jgi:galactonate dehydratase
MRIRVTEAQRRSRLVSYSQNTNRDSSKPQVAITDVAAVAVREPMSKRTHAILTISTDAGVTGIGELPSGTRAEPVTRNVSPLRQLLTGTDALAPEALRQQLLQQRPDVVNLLGAINTALLDIAGKIARVPVYEVLSGRTRDKARAMASLGGNTPAAFAESAKRAFENGYRAFLVPVSGPFGEPRGRASGRDLRAWIERVREDLSQSVDFVIDCDGRMKPSDATSLATELETVHPLWLDEPCADVSIESLRRIAEETVVPIGVGRAAGYAGIFQDLLAQDAVGVIRPSVTRLGIGQARKAAAIAETYYVAVAPFHRGGPIATAAVLHLAASIPNFFILEIPTPASDEDQLMRRELVTVEVESPQDGFLPLPTGPGLGIELNPEALEKYRV